MGLILRRIWNGYDPVVDQPTLYQQVGGERAVRDLVDRFYDRMDEDDSVAPLRQMHAKSLKGSRQKLFEFLSGWLGGPQLYVEKYGHPRLRRRHMPFSIDLEGRDQWMRCMRQALDESIDDPDLRKGLGRSFHDLANHMRNQLEVERE